VIVNSAASANFTIYGDQTGAKFRGVKLPPGTAAGWFMDPGFGVEGFTPNGTATSRCCVGFGSTEAYVGIEPRFAAKNIPAVNRIWTGHNDSQQLGDGISRSVAVGRCHRIMTHGISRLEGVSDPDRDYRTSDRSRTSGMKNIRRRRQNRNRTLGCLHGTPANPQSDPRGRATSTPAA